MVKNLTGGNKAKGFSKKKINLKKIKLFKKPNEFEYIGKITKEFGSARFEVETFFDKALHKINCSAPRSIRVKTDDFILLTIIRESKNKLECGEIVHKYNPENMPELISYEDIQSKNEKRENIINLLNRSAVIESGDNSFVMENYEITDININDI